MMEITTKQHLEYLSTIKAHLSEWEVGFLESIQDQVAGRGQHSRRQKKSGINALSGGQTSWVKKIYDRYPQNVLQLHKEWKEKFKADEVLKDNFRVCIEYYSHGQYYSNLVKKSKADPEFVPSERDYKKICENKYSTKILTAYRATPKYDLGAYVSLRACASAGMGGPNNSLIRLKGQRYDSERVENRFMVVLNNITPTSAAKGSKIYKIMHLGTAQVFKYEERDIKKCRKEYRND